MREKKLLQVPHPPYLPYYFSYSKLDAALEFVRNNWQNLSQHPEDVDSLRQAIERLAVQGKLIPQDLEDELLLFFSKGLKTKRPV